MTTDGNRIVCLTYSMQDIRENLRQASKQASEGSLEEAIQTLEQIVLDCKDQECVGGKFCAYKHLGDLYCKIVLVSQDLTCRDGMKILFGVFKRPIAVYSQRI